jgi:hypothetical protein
MSEFSNRAGNSAASYVDPLLTVTRELNQALLCSHRLMRDNCPVSQNLGAIVPEGAEERTL